MGDVVQDPAGASTTGDPGRHRLVSTLSAPAGQGAARRAHEAYPGAFQLLRGEWQLSQYGVAPRGGDTRLVQVAPSSEPTQSPHLVEVCGATQALSSSTAPDHRKDLGHVTASHISGRAGWWKSPCPDLARAPRGEPLGATLQLAIASRIAEGPGGAQTRTWGQGLTRGVRFVGKTTRRYAADRPLRCRAAGATIHSRKLSGRGALVVIRRGSSGGDGWRKPGKAEMVEDLCHDLRVG
jgi:hypothetical protein